MKPILILINGRIIEVFFTRKYILKLKSQPMILDYKLLKFRSYSLMLYTYYIINSCSFKTMCKHNAYTVQTH